MIYLANVGKIDVTQPGAGAALGLSPIEQAIASRQRDPKSLLTASVNQFGDIFQ